MNTTHRTARIAAVLLVALVSWAIAAPFAFGAAASGPRAPKARTPQVRWYHWHPTARQLHAHYGSKVVIGEGPEAGELQHHLCLAQRSSRRCLHGAR